MGIGICAPCVCFESSGSATDPNIVGAPPGTALCSMIFIWGRWSHAQCAVVAAGARKKKWEKEWGGEGTIIISLAFCLVRNMKCSLYFGL
jgi:hypothetical protein